MEKTIDTTQARRLACYDAPSDEPAKPGQVYASDEGWKFWYQFDQYCVQHRRTFRDAEAAEQEMRLCVAAMNRALLGGQRAKALG